MKQLFCSLFFLASALFADETAKTLNAMQQLRTLMPERLWIQEFSIRVDRKAFKDHIAKMMERRERERVADYGYALARSRDYLLRSTMSGENIRIHDFYQEFEESPFWRTPDAMNRLYRLEGRK